MPSKLHIYYSYRNSRVRRIPETRKTPRTGYRRPEGPLEKSWGQGAELALCLLRGSEVSRILPLRGRFTGVVGTLEDTLRDADKGTWIIRLRNSRGHQGHVPMGGCHYFLTQLKKKKSILMYIPMRQGVEAHFSVQRHIYMANLYLPSKSDFPGMRPGQNDRATDFE